MVGMAQADVAEALGSPNIVTRSGSGREAWIYEIRSNGKIRPWQVEPRIAPFRLDLQVAS